MRFEQMMIEPSMLCSGKCTGMDRSARISSSLFTPHTDLRILYSGATGGPSAPIPQRQTDIQEGSVPKANEGARTIPDREQAHPSVAPVWPDQPGRPFSPVSRPEGKTC